MKALKISELDIVVRELQTLCGSRLQEAFVSNRDVILQFHSSKHGVRWLVVDLSPQSPSLWVLDQVPFQWSKVKTPLSLFLRAHFKGMVLAEVKRDFLLGRVVYLSFESDQVLQIEIRLFPHGQNVLLVSRNKKISLKKIQNLEVFSSASVGEGESVNLSYEDLKLQWLDHRVKPLRKDKSKGLEREKKIKKLEKSLVQQGNGLQLLKSFQWKRAGEELVRSQSLLETATEFPEHVDVDLGLSENIQICFEKHKKNLKKIAGAKQRMMELEEELAGLRLMSDEEFLKLQNSRISHRQKSKGSQPQGSIKTRKLMVAGDLEFLVGKSAKDNMSLLRRARAWDYWFHLQDFPSAHGILFRHRNRQVSDQEAHLAARFLAETHADKNKNIHSGELLAVIWTESRFVRPVKGDKMGRVTHKNIRSLLVKL